LIAHDARIAVVPDGSELSWNVPAYYSKGARSGQALVEFTLVFMLMLVVAWIPADFGLAFLSGQLALNSSREGASIALLRTQSDTDGNEAAVETCKRSSISAISADPGSAFGASCLPNSRARVDIACSSGY
jgi:Flp pilus assembly protein TadG